MHFAFPEEGLICFLAKKESRKLPSKDERTHGLVVGKFQPGLILHGALAQVNSCGARKGTQAGQCSLGASRRSPAVSGGGLGGPCDSP